MFIFTEQKHSEAPLLKTMMISPWVAGKTTLLESFKQKRYCPIGDSTYRTEKFIIDVSIENSVQSGIFYDTQHDVDHNFIDITHLKEMNSIMLLFPLKQSKLCEGEEKAIDTPEDPRKRITKLVDYLRGHIRDSSMPFLLVGTMSDVPPNERIFKYDDGLALAKELNLSGYMECSARNDLPNVQKIFQKAMQLAKPNTIKLSKNTFYSHVNYPTVGTFGSINSISKRGIK